MIGENIIELGRTDSTNLWAARAMERQEFPDGTVVRARDQYDGRGQHDHSWISEPGKNLTFTLILHPGFLPPGLQFLLNMAISLGILDYVRKVTAPLLSQTQYPVHPISGFLQPAPLHKKNQVMPGVCVKWPNDIYLGGRKIAGILIENKILGDQIETVLVGIGLNVNQQQFSSALPDAGSLIGFLGHELELNETLTALCGYLEKRYQMLRRERFAVLTRDYCQSLLGFNQWRSFLSDGNSIEGKITGVDLFGRLVVETRNGERIAYNHRTIEFA